MQGLPARNLLAEAIGGAGDRLPRRLSGRSCERPCAWHILTITAASPAASTQATGCRVVGFARSTDPDQALDSGI
jgi:hypothetical protein